MVFFLSTISFMVLLGIIVVVHELGHLIIARANGVYCEAFSFGFGPVLFETIDKVGTKWRFSLIPLGGYVKMFGDADYSSVKEKIPDGYTEEDMDRMSAHRKKPWQRLLISVGGPLFNLVFAVLLIFSINAIKGVPEYGNSINVPSETSVAYKAGLRTGDVILSANGKKIAGFLELKEQILASKMKTLDLKVVRGEETKSIKIEMFEKNAEKTVPITVIGVAPNDVTFKKIGVVDALASAVNSVYATAYGNLSAILKIAIGKVSVKEVGGVISIFKLSSDSAESGFVSFLLMVATLSAILGAVNLLPIPVLDGGAIVISMIEWLIGRPLNKKIVESVFTVGLVIVAGLMLLGIWNDLSSFKFFNWLESFIK